MGKGGGRGEGHSCLTWFIILYFIKYIIKFVMLSLGVHLD